MRDASQAEGELERALRTTSTAECVRALAQAWVAWPSAELEAVTVALGEALPAAPLDATTLEDLEARWHAVADRRDPAELPSLLATPWLANPKAAMARLEKLAAFDPDPRIVDHLIDLDTGERFLSAAGQRFWSAAWRLMLQWGSVAAARRLPSAAPGATEPPWAAVRWAGTFEPLRREFAGRLPEELAVTPIMRTQLQTLSARIDAAQRDVWALFERVYEDPDANAPRQVLADALVERGDPRGEFALLQFAHERGELTFGRRERMLRLLSGAGRRWFLGLLGQVSSQAVFRRGLVAEVQLATRTPDTGAPAWKLVEGLSTAGLALPLADVLRNDALPRLARLYDLRPETFVNLVRGSQRSFSLAELRGLPPQVPESACAFDVLRLRSDAEDAVRWFLSTRLKASALEVDVLTGGLRRLGGLLAPLGATPVTRLTLSHGAPPWPEPWRGAWTASFSRTGGTFDALEIVLHGELPTHLDELIAGAQLPVRVRTTARKSLAARQQLTTFFAQLGVKDLDLQTLVPLAPKPVILDVR